VRHGPALLAVLVAASCAGGPNRTAAGFSVTARCEPVRAPGGMVATVASATVVVAADRNLAAAEFVVELVDSGRVAASVRGVEADLLAGEERTATVTFDAPSEEGITVQPGASCRARAVT
jgi:hypothetical protein